MKQRLLFFIRFFLLLLGIFLLSKPVFMMAGGRWHVGEWLAVMYHGLPLDLATSAYLSVLVWLSMMVSVWWPIPRFRTLFSWYAGIVSTLTTIILVANICLYSFWGFPLDGTVFNYLDSPGDAVASVSGWYVIGVTALVILLSLGIHYLFRRIRFDRFEPCRHRMAATGGALLLGGLLFLCIRGGVGKSTANVGMVYYSEDRFLNHAAVNPAFSIVYSMFKTRDFSKQFDFYPEAERAEKFARLAYSTESRNTESQLRIRRPNVLIILMEGCGGTFVHAVDSLSDPNITPNLNAIAREGVCFTRCYANSFRTDRGTLCALSGFPSFPDVSVMKLPRQCAHLPSIASSLRQAGYATEFLYGGDINFTNTNGYLLATGYERTYGDTSFSMEERRTHNWGVTDHIVFGRLREMLDKYPADKPWHTGMLTLASHEPWVVPYDRIKGDKVANSMAYLDDCIGKFIRDFKQSRWWNNTLVIILPDHGIEYPSGISHTDSRRNHIPMIWTGGAISRPRTVDILCNQTDLAATLLGQLGLSHEDFPFSRDVFSTTYTHPSAVYTWPEGISYKDETGETVLNLMTKPVSVFVDAPSPSAARQEAARCFLQTAYDALGEMGKRP